MLQLVKLQPETPSFDVKILLQPTSLILTDLRTLMSITKHFAVFFYKPHLQSDWMEYWVEINLCVFSQLAALLWLIKSVLPSLIVYLHYNTILINASPLLIISSSKCFKQVPCGAAAHFKQKLIFIHLLPSSFSLKSRSNFKHHRVICLNLWRWGQTPFRPE